MATQKKDRVHSTAKETQNTMRFKPSINRRKKYVKPTLLDVHHALAVYLESESALVYRSTSSGRRFTILPYLGFFAIVLAVGSSTYLVTKPKDVEPYLMRDVCDILKALEFGDFPW